MPDKSVALDKKVPAFACAATGGKRWKLTDAAGKKLVIYFYPKHNTAGCTKEGEAFRDLYPAFKKAGTIVVGISPDSVESHEKFKAKMKFPFDLLADEERSVCALFDVYEMLNASPLTTFTSISPRMRSTMSSMIPVSRSSA